jgi:hypothetical protein
VPVGPVGPPAWPVVEALADALADAVAVAEALAVLDAVAVLEGWVLGE